MILHPPFIITARLMAGLKIGKAFISMSAGPRNAEGRTQYDCWIDLPPEHGGGGHRVADLRSGCQGDGLQAGFASLLTFLSYAGEAHSNGGDRDGNLFPTKVLEWADEEQTELGMVAYEFENGPALIAQESEANYIRVAR